MSISSRYIAPMALSFATAIATPTFAVEPDVETTSMTLFSCDMKDLSGLTARDWLPEVLPATVMVTSTKSNLMPWDIFEKMLGSIPPQMKEMLPEEKIKAIQEKMEEIKGKLAELKAEFPDGLTPEKLHEFFPDLFDEQSSAPIGLGSGFVINPKGYILTNNHVVDGSEKVNITFYDPNGENGQGEEVEATILGTDELLDLALVKVDVDQALPCLSPADSSKVMAGDRARAVGHPNGLSFTFTQGAVSFVGRVGVVPYPLIQTDAAINHGNSGGPLLADSGEFMGINTLIISQSGGSAGLGFAIESNDIVKNAKVLFEHGKIPRAGLGVSINDLTRDQAKANNLKQHDGVYVNGVGPDTPADKAGIKAGDIILKVDGVEMNTSKELKDKIMTYVEGSEIDIIVLRENTKMSLHIMLTGRDNAIQFLEDERKLKELEMQKKNLPLPEQMPQIPEHAQP